MGTELGPFGAVPLHRLLFTAQNREAQYVVALAP